MTNEIKDTLTLKKSRHDNSSDLFQMTAAVLMEVFEGLYEKHDSFNLLKSPCCFCFANSLICTVFFISLLLCVTHFVSGCHHMWRSQEMSIKNKQTNKYPFCLFNAVFINLISMALFPAHLCCVCVFLWPYVLIAFF